MGVKKKKPKKALGGLVTADVPNSMAGKKYNEFKKGLRPPAQFASNGIPSSTASVEVGKRRYQLQGNARAIVDELRENPNRTFKAMTLEPDEHWRPGKENVKVTISAKGNPLIGYNENLVSKINDAALIAVFSPAITGGLITIQEGKKAISSINLTYNIATSNAAQFSNKKPILPAFNGVMYEDTYPTVNPKSFGGAMRRLKDNISKNLLDPVSSFIRGPAGESISDIAHTNIIVKIDAYINPTTVGLNLDMGKNKVTTGEIADLIEGLVLGKKNIKNTALVLDQLTRPQVNVDEKAQGKMLQDNNNKPQNKSRGVKL